jgi:integrase
MAEPSDAYQPRPQSCARSGRIAFPPVLTVEEAWQVIAAVSPPVAGLVVRLLYGSELRLLEAWMLRVKDVDFACGQHRDVRSLLTFHESDKRKTRGGKR